MKPFDAIIIGAGPAGMMSAIRAAERNRKILLIEQNDTLGKKLLISGKGRCNITNSCALENFLRRFSKSRDFLRNTFAKFFSADLISFFESAGLKLKIEEDGRVFPASDRSSDILNILKSKLKNENIKILLGERVLKVIIKDKKIEGVLVYSGKRFLTEHIVIAAGGASYPRTGSTGEGCKIAEKLGHKIIPLKPALAPILIKERFISDWQGIALKDVRLTLFAGGKKISEKFGEMIFTHFGLSGPLVLDISAPTYDALQLTNDVAISINFKPGIGQKMLDTRLLGEFKANPNKNIKNMFKNLLPQGTIKRFLEYSGINGNKNINQITSEERKRIVMGLSDLRLTVKGVMPIEDGMVTRGGVNTLEINPKTMESKLIKGLFFAGEVIDIDAETGGYNMQAAFSTGWVSGDNV